MALKGSPVLPRRLPSAPRSRSPGSRSAGRSASGTRRPGAKVQNVTDSPRAWNPIHSAIYRQQSKGPQKCRPLTVYDIMPPGLGGKAYTTWTEEWLPRLEESHELPGQKCLIPTSRNPTGFAINPKHTTAFKRSDIHPTILHFNGKTKKQNGPSKPVTAEIAHHTKVASIPRIYTKSAFRREPQPSPGEFNETRPAFTRKKMPHTVSTASAGALPMTYQLPERGDEHARLAAILPEVRLENYMEPDRRKYLVFSRSLNATNSGSRGRPISLHYATNNVRPEDELEQFGIRYDPYNMIRLSVSQRGTLHHGNTCKGNGLRTDADDAVPDLLVVNKGSRSRPASMIKVKDALDGDITYSN